MIENNNFPSYKLWCIIHSDKALKGIVVNRALPFLQRRSLKITLTVPLTQTIIVQLLILSVVILHLAGVISGRSFYQGPRSRVSRSDPSWAQLQMYANTGTQHAPLTLSLTASTLLQRLVLLSDCFIYPMSGRYSTNWDQKGWPGSEIQMYYGCPVTSITD